jgi:hypothetical protein
VELLVGADFVSPALKCAESKGFPSWNLPGTESVLRAVSAFGMGGGRAREWVAVIASVNQYVTNGI